MFLQLRLSRDGARFRGAPCQATTAGRSFHLGWRGHRPAVEMWGEPGRRANSGDLVPGTWSFLTFPPYMVTGASPDERAHANAQEDSNGEWWEGNGSRPELEEEASTSRAPPTPSDYPLWLHPQRPPATNLARLGPCSSGSVAESRDAAGGAALGSERGSLKASWAGRLRRVRKHALCWRD